MYPLKFHPILKSMLWGGEQIIPYKGIDIEQSKVGESWEISGVAGNESVVSQGPLAGKTITELLEEFGAQLVGKANYERFGNEFPLLIKFIDAKDDLSIQVHPDDKLAAERHNSKGKTEMWYVVDATADAKLRSGFSRQVSAQEYVAAVENDTVTDILKEYNVAAGDLFFLPAGRIHSIGAGCFIAEIQQTSNITYRIYDFNRKDDQGNSRELHTEQAKGAIDYTLLDDYRTHYDRQAKDQEVELVECPYFKTSLYDLAAAKTLDFTALDSFVIVICVEGSAAMVCDGVEMSIAQGESILIPATSGIVEIAPNGGCKLLTTSIE
ncbi:MAG: type I phosphomannose isomerase catalytic subunit [Rikenellaceae bacterium]